MRWWYLALLAAVTVPAAAQPADQLSLKARAAANMARGDELYAYDQSAWRVTDAAVAALPKATMNIARGYITSQADDGYRTTFFGGEAGSHFRLYTAVWTKGVIVRPELFAPESRVPVTPEEKRLIAARDVAFRNSGGLAMCSEARANSAVISGATANDPISVYIMTPQAKTDVLPMGGHHRLDVKDGKVVAKRTFAKSCIALERPRGSKKQGEPVAMMITHLLDPVPTEIHAFTMHSTGLPLYVVVPDGNLYEVSRKDGKAVALVIKAK